MEERLEKIENEVREVKERLDNFEKYFINLDVKVTEIANTITGVFNLTPIALNVAAAQRVSMEDIAEAYLRGCERLKNIKVV